MNEADRQKTKIANDKVEQLAKKAGLAKHGLGWTAWESQLENFARLVFNAGFESACEWRDSQVLRTTEDDPCPACRPNTVCRTPSCGRLKGKRQEPIAPPTAQINRKLVEALELAETEMRYAGWGTPVADNSGLKNAYEAVVAALAATQVRGYA